MESESLNDKFIKINENINKATEQILSTYNDTKTNKGIDFYDMKK